MTTTPPSPESLAQARAERRYEAMEQLSSEPGTGEWQDWAERCITERATVIELRRELAEANAGLRCKQCHQPIVGSMTSIAPWWCLLKVVAGEIRELLAADTKEAP